MRDPRLALALLALFALAAGAALTTGCGSSSSSDPDPEPEPEFTHAAYFAENPYSGTNLNTACVECHTEAAGDILNTAHWLWEGTDNKIEGYTATAHGKTDLLNNFCIAIATNEGRCTQCHIGVGWKDDTFDFSNTAAIDCLVCHDTTGTYAKDPKTAGAPVASITDADWLAIGSAVGSPRRNNCGACHYKAGGGDNVKHGDLAVNLNSTTREYDVHMGTDGGNFTCQRCHEADADHGIGGMPIHHVDEGNMRQCADCHSGDNAPDHSGVAAFSVGALQHGPWPARSATSRRSPATARRRPPGCGQRPATPAANPSSTPSRACPTTTR